MSVPEERGGGEGAPPVPENYADDWWSEMEADSQRFAAPPPEQQAPIPTSEPEGTRE
jgi:hypothetical protein